MKKERLRVSADQAATLRAGLRTELGIASEKIASLAESVSEHPKRAYATWRKLHEQACAALDEVGWMSSGRAITVDFTAHRAISLKALRGQRRSYLERMDEIEKGEQLYATERIEDIQSLLRAIRYS